MAKLRTGTTASEEPSRHVAQRVSHAAPQRDRSGILDLQRALGNRAATGLLSRLQPSLVVGSASDPAEREADAAAGAVAARVQRESAAPAGAAGGELDETTASRVNALRGGGAPLPRVMRSAMEGAFGANFSAVRLHRGPEAHALNDKVDAHAFTLGSDIFLGRSAPELSSPAGTHLLAHELTHTIQQGANAAGQGATASPARGASVQRYAKSALAHPPIPPTDWDAETAEVRKSSGGRSGGVYFFRARDNKSAVPEVAVKPVYGRNDLGVETAAMMVAGDRIVSELFGLGAPSSRVVAGGSPEFRQLTAKMAPLEHRPTAEEEPDELKRREWKPVTEAQDVVVMGKVPNGVSLSDLAESAWSNTDNSARLHNAVFNPAFLHDLGMLMVADLLMGNDDRMVANSMNLGNVMLSMSDGTDRLVAIDTKAMLGVTPPEKYRQFGSGSQGFQIAGLTGGGNVAQHLERPPSHYLDGFFQGLSSWYRGGPIAAKNGQSRVAGQGEVDPAAELLERYQAVRDQCVEAFTGGWHAGLSTARTLVESKQGRQQMRGLTEDMQKEPNSEHVTYTTLKSNARYLSGRAKGQSHEETGSDVAAYNALAQLASFDRAAARIPEDEFYWTAARVPGKDTLSAALTSVPGLPEPPAMSVFKKDQDGRGIAWTLDDAELRRIGEIVATAKGRLTEELGRKKRSGQSQQRNRVVAGNFIAETYLLGAGTVRAVRRALDLVDLANLLAVAATGSPNTSQASRALLGAMFLNEYLPRLRNDLGEYEVQLKASAKAVRQIRRYGQRDALAEELERRARYAAMTVKDKLSAKVLANTNLYVNVLRSSTR